jgi:hypothetical protein
LYKYPARKKKTKEMLLLNIREAYLKFPGEDKHGDSLNQVKLQDLPLFNLQELASATNNIHLSNKLGQGGFGPAYRVIVVLVEGY